MLEIRMLKTEEPQFRSGFVLNFGHFDFDVVSDFGLRASDLTPDWWLPETGQIAEIGDRISEADHKSPSGNEICPRLPSIRTKKA